MLKLNYKFTNLIKLKKSPIHHNSGFAFHFNILVQVMLIFQNIYFYTNLARYFWCLFICLFNQSLRVDVLLLFLFSDLPVSESIAVCLIHLLKNNVQFLDDKYFRTRLLNFAATWLTL